MLIDVVREFAADTALWRSRLQVPQHAQRWWARLHADDQLDVWLLSWLPGQATELHDHGSSGAAFCVLRGRLQEVRIDPDGRCLSWPRLPGSPVEVAPGVIHDVHGAGRGVAASIHAYSPPLRVMNYYRLDPRGGLRAVRSVRTHEPEEELAG